MGARRIEGPRRSAGPRFVPWLRRGRVPGRLEGSDLGQQVTEPQLSSLDPLWEFLNVRDRVPSTRRLSLPAIHGPDPAPVGLVDRSVPAGVAAFTRDARV